MNKQKANLPSVQGRGGVFGGGKGGSSSSSGGIQQPNTLQNNSYAFIVDLISEGPIAGFYDLVSEAAGGSGLNQVWGSIYWNNVPVLGQNNEYNYQGVTQAGWEYGESAQNPLPGFAAASNEVQVGAEVLHDVPIVQVIDDPNVNAVGITIEFPALYQYFTSNGDVDDTTVEITVEIAGVDGNYEVVVNDVITGKCTSPYERGYLIGLSAWTGPFNIRVSRITADSTDANLVNQFYWISYTEIIQGNFMYPSCAVFGCSIDAQYFGSSIPVRSYNVLGIMVNIPTNYNAITGVYTGTWDGTFQIAWTNNPVWILLDLLINPRYGLGAQISIDNVDLGSFYLAAQYCDEWIQDGFGGTEKRYTFNGAIVQQQEAYKVLQAVAASFRGILFWTAGTVYVMADMPLDPVMLVSPANVIDAKFTYSGTARKARHTACLVTWKNPAINYNDDVEFVQDNEGIQTLGYRSTQLVAFGCTSRGQAHRLGLWILDTEQTQTETVVYQASYDHAQIKPGNVIAVADPAYAGVRFGGRIMSYTMGDGSDTIELDAPVLMDAGQSYQFQCIFPDGTVAELTDIITPPGLVQTIQLAGNLSQAASVGAMWIITGSDVAPRQFQVQSIREVSKSTYEITALFYDPTKYARIEDGITLKQPSYQQITVGPCAPPTNLAVIETVFYANGVPTSRLTFGWTASTDILASQYQVNYIDPSGQNHILPPTSTMNVSINPAVLGDWQFSVFAITSDGRQSVTETISYTATGKDSAPDPVTGLSAAGIIGGVQLSWSLPGDPDLGGVQIYQGTSATFSGASVVGTSGGSNYTITGLADNTTYYFWAETFDTSGNFGDPVGPVSSQTAFVLATAVANAILATAAFAQGINVPALEPTLPNPATWSGADLIYTEDTGQLYEFSAGPPAAWVKNYTGLSSLYTSAFALGINIPSVVSTLPTTGTEGQTVTLTTDGQLYRYHDGAWTAEVPGTSIVANSITAAQIAAGAIGADQIAANSITAGQIAAGAIGAAEIAAGSIVGSNIAANTITGANIQADSINCSALTSSTITAADIYLGTVVGSSFLRLHSATDGSGNGPFIQCQDSSGTNRVVLGQIGGDWGLEVYDSAGNAVVLIDGALGLDVVGGSQLQNEAVNTNHVVPGAITNAGQNTGSSGVNSSSWTTIASVTMSVAGRATIIMGSALTTAHSDNDIEFGLAVDGSLIWSGGIASGGCLSIAQSVSLGAGAHSFALQTQIPSGQESVNYQAPSITVFDGQV